MDHESLALLEVDRIAGGPRAFPKASVKHVIEDHGRKSRDEFLFGNQVKIRKLTRAFILFFVGTGWLKKKKKLDYRMIA